MIHDPFRCYLASKGEDGKVTGEVTQQPLTSLPEGEVLIEVTASSLNYKDGLAANGHPGVVKTLPHVPGIDAVGTVAESTSDQFAPDDPVLVTGFELGAGQWGGWSQHVRVPAEWVIPLPNGLHPTTAMQLGTAGLTAALSVDALLAHHIKPDDGEILVTGSTGGVGILAVKLLAKLGYQVVAVSGKKDKYDWLKELGAVRVIGREEVVDDSKRPLLKAQWAGAVDTVGGETLATILRSTKLGGCVTACGLVGGDKLPTTVYPFILRGVTLCGIDSAWCPREKRSLIWQKLGGEWELDGLNDITTTVNLDEIGDLVPEILAGKIAGRVVVRI